VRWYGAVAVADDGDNDDDDDDDDNNDDDVHGVGFRSLRFTHS